MSNLSNKSRERLTKAFTVLTSVTTALSMSGVMYLAPTALAVAPADYGLKEGDVVSAAGSDDPDVYIVNEMGYKRLFLNPAIFNFYGHLGGFAAVKNVSPATRDAFGTSGLFRNCETNDEKVYGVETTGEDTGMLHWVNTPGSQAVIDDANFFKKVFCINSNEFNWYSKGSDYTSVNQVPSYSRTPGATPTPVAVPGAVMVSLSPSNPAAKTITIDSYGEVIMGLRFTGTGKVNELSFKRGGPGATANYDNLYIYDGARRLTGGRTPSSADGTVTFISLAVDVAGTKDLTLVADHAGTSGNVNYWELTGVKLDSGTASGFPLMSNNFTFAGATSGTINVDKTGSVANPKVGQKVAHLSEFKVTANTEAAFIKRVQLINGGDVKSSDITNLYLEVLGTKVADGKMTTDGFAVFDFAAPGYKIAKGDNRIFKMFGDLAGKKSETVKFYLEQKSDVTAVGDQFGYGMKPTVDSNFDDSTNTHSLTLQGGALTITFNGPTATNVGTNTTDTVLARYSMTAVSTIEVKKLGLILCNDTGANNYEDAHDTTNGWADLDDIKITDEDTGQVLVGPADGSAFKLNEATGCPDSATGAGKIFTDTFDLVGGKTRNLKVTADIKTANTRSGVALVATDLIKVVLDGYGESDMATSTGDVSVLKYAGTNVAVDDSDILPSTDLGSNNMTIQSSSLTIGLSSTPKSTTYVKGTKAVEAAGFTFAASLASDLKVTDITLTGYVADSGTALTIGVGTGLDTSLNVSNLVSAVKLYDGSTGAVVAETASSNNLNSSTATVKFNNLNWTIPAGQTKVLLVKTDLSSNATSGTSDVFSFDINTTTDITALDSASSTVNAGNSDPNGNTSPTVIATVANSGTIVVSAAPATPISEAKYWGQAGTEFARYRVRANDEAFYIERFNINHKTGTAADATNNVKNVKVQYTNEAGSTLTSSAPLNNDTRPSVSFGFTGDNRPYVPKDSSIDIIVLADLKNKAEGATSEVNFSLDFAGGDGTDDSFGDDEFRAVGKGSGQVIDADPASGNTVADLEANNMYVYRVFPKFTKETLSVVGEPLGTKDVLKFTIKAEGLSDAKVLFNDPASVALRFEVVASGGADSDMTFNLYVVSTGELIASRTALSAPTDGPSVQNSDSSTGLGRASVAFNDWERDFEIAGGTSTTFRVEAAFVNFSQASDYFSLVLRDETSTTNPVIQYVDGARSGEDQDITHTAGVFRLLPMSSDTFTKN